VNYDLELLFPRLHGVQYEITSPAAPDYNCIAWAAGDTSRWWEPDPFEIYYWPKDVPRLPTLESYSQTFQTLGFDVCEDPDFDLKWEKVAIFTGSDGIPTHAARQLSDGTWTSKLGQLEDIKHPNLSNVSGRAYGEVTLILRRPKVG